MKPDCRTPLLNHHLREGSGHLTLVKGDPLEVVTLHRLTGDPRWRCDGCHEAEHDAAESAIANAPDGTKLS